MYWQPVLSFARGRKMVLWSQEPPRDPKADFGKRGSLAFARSHLWIYEIGQGLSTEIKLPSLTTIAGVLPGERRLLVAGNRGGRTFLLTSNLQGGDREVIHSKRGYAYGTSLSPDGSGIAFHIIIPDRNPYEIYVIDVRNREETLIASDPDCLNFGTNWSRDGRWILYQRCLYRIDHGHERSDIWISRADGSEHRALTEGRRHWFATSYGTPETRGNGSNMPAWSPDGRAITHSRLLPGSRTAWRYRTDRPDRDHFNRDYEPERARGGTEICLLDPETGGVERITCDDPPVWNWRAEWSPDSREISFSRAPVGAPSEVWLMDASGGDRRYLTKGLNGMGADFARFYRLSGQI